MDERNGHCIVYSNCILIRGRYYTRAFTSSFSFCQHDRIVLYKVNTGASDKEVNNSGI